MVATTPDVLGINYGTLASFITLIDQNGVDDDTLYFITDRGLLYRGSSLVVPLNVVEANPHPNQVNTYTFTLTYYSDNPKTPTVVRFNVPTAEALSAVSSTLGSHRLISGTTYADGKASSSNYGHVMLSDAVNASSPSAASGGTAVTPKGVYDYVNDLIGGMNVQSDWNEDDPTSPAYIHDKPDFLDVVAENNPGRTSYRLKFKYRQY